MEKKTLSVANRIIWYICTKKECTGELRNIKRQERPQQTTLMDNNICFPGEEALLHSSLPEQEHPPQAKRTCVPMLYYVVRFC